jgi:hypothetical protein
MRPILPKPHDILRPALWGGCTRSTLLVRGTTVTTPPARAAAVFAVLLLTITAGGRASVSPGVRAATVVDDREDSHAFGGVVEGLGHRTEAASDEPCRR